MEVTAAFRDAFAISQARQHNDTHAAATPASSLQPAHSDGVQRLTDSLASVQTLIEKALLTCERRIHATLAAMDVCAPHALDCEKALLLSEAELATADASAKALVEALKVIAVAARDAKREAPPTAQDEPGADHNSWLRHALEKTQHGKSTAAAAAEASSPLSLSGDQLLHFEALLAVLTSRLSQCQLRLALCKEELALYKNERYAFGRCGVLSCSDPTAKTRSASSGASPQPSSSPERAVTSQNTLSSTAAKKPHKVAGFGFVTDVSKLTMNTVDEVFRKTSSTVKGASALAADTKLGAAALSTLRAGIDHIDVELFGADRKRAGSVPTDSGIAVPHFELTDDERAALERQNANLVLEQREASTQEAKAIEVSVRELAQLTTLMNEKVVEQSEQFSILLKNTDAAHTNVKKALEQVQKPKNAFWNSTRQLIALLWMCTAFLMLSNWWIR